MSQKKTHEISIFIYIVHQYVQKHIIIEEGNNIYFIEPLR